ncbi:MAG TPA: hypothetical protein VGK29_01695 [Paludibaculum sp.]|jgi:hypothetical protein
MLATVVLLLHFAAPEDVPLAAQMQPELDSLFANSTVQAQILVDSNANYVGTPSDVVFVNIRHGCRPALGSTFGTLARTHRVDGIIQPLVEIDCAKVATYIRSTSGLPRALARILAHELLHYLWQQAGHARAGVFRECLSRSELTAPALRLY